MSPVKLQNVYVKALDMEASRLFYEELLGITPAFADGEHWTQYRIEGKNFALAGSRELADADSDAIVVFEVDDLEALRDEVSRLGGKMLGTRDMGDHGRTLTVSDPSGVVVQFFVRTSPARRA